MEIELLQALTRLANSGWSVRVRPDPLPLPDNVKNRYSWLPFDVESFLGEIELASRGDDGLWLLSSREFRGETDSAYLWNECESQSLSAADGDIDWGAAIKKFWDGHFPIAFSVADGYAYFALRPDKTVVYGREPEFEETEVYAASFLEFLDRIGSEVA